jgi:predicted ABC-type ATPase
VNRAKAVGFEVRLIYVFVRSVELRLERIRLRVAKGGHDVPEDKVRDRRARSFAQLSWFFKAADQAWIFDNSRGAPKLVARKEPQKTTLSAKLPTEIMQSLLNPKNSD